MKIRLTVLGILAVIIIFVMLTGCGALSPAQRYQMEARKMEYPFWLKNEKQHKEDWRIRVAKNQVEAAKLKQERQAEENRILEEVQRIKSQIGNE